LAGFASSYAAFASSEFSYRKPKDFLNMSINALFDLGNAEFQKLYFLWKDLNNFRFGYVFVK
jgi:hypothetical protein